MVVVGSKSKTTSSPLGDLADLLTAVTALASVLVSGGMPMLVVVAARGMIPTGVVAMVVMMVAMPMAGPALAWVSAQEATVAQPAVVATLGR